MLFSPKRSLKGIEIFEIPIWSKNPTDIPREFLYILLQKYVLVFLIEEYVPMIFDP